MTDVTITLTTPVQAHGATISAITLRPPKGRDLRLHGMPYRLSGSEQNPEMVTDAQATSKLISALGNIPTSSVDMLDAADWMACMTAVAGFLGGGTPATTSTATTNAPDGGATSHTSSNSRSRN